MAIGTEVFFQIAICLQDFLARDILFCSVKIKCFTINQLLSVNVNIVEIILRNSIQFIFISPQTSQYIGQHNEKNYIDGEKGHLQI
jgi:hypothetical protein